MAQAILVVTSTPGFGELIEQTLNETGLYQVVLVLNTQEAIAKAKAQPFALAILDEECNKPLLDLVRQLRNLLPDIRLIVIPLSEEPNPEVASLELQGVLSKPFYLPDLLETVHKTLKYMPIKTEQAQEPAGTPTAAASANSGSIDWMQDAARAAQHLTSLSLESSALAALIVRNRKLWSYAGQLPQPAAQELTMIIANYWSQGVVLPPGSKREGKSDLARFIRLEATGGEYMLYATEVANGMVLALVFDAETPFGKIRTQASRLAHALTTPPASNSKTPEAKNLPANTNPPMPSASLKQPTPPVVSQPEPKKTTETPVSSTEGTPGTSGQEDEELDLPLKIPPLWEDVPPPDPGGGRSKNTIPSPQTDLPPIIQPVLPVSVDTQAKEPEPVLLPAREPEVKTEPAVQVSQSQQVETPAPVEPVLYSSFQPVSPAVYFLDYACLMIPRMTKHHMTGDLAEKISIWMGELCMAFAWRLEQINIQPDYLQWVANVPPTTSPSYLLRVIRQQTSQRIFATFPDLAHENPSGDYWAPGYLVISSSQPPSEQIISDFIEQVRQHQGVSRPSSPYSRGR